MRRALAFVVALALSAAAAPPASGGPQDPDEQDVLDRRPDPAQPDYTIVNLPSSLRLPRLGSAFRVTHRFARPLGEGSFGDLVSDLFGLDAAAQIGLEYRFGLLRGLQVGLHRTNEDKTVMLFGTYDLVPERGEWPVGVAVHASIDGTNNFGDHYSPALGLILSRSFGSSASVAVQPIWVANANLQPLPGEDEHTFLLGLGGRFRVRPTVYLVGEVVPRLAGFDPGAHAASFAVEKRAGGHVFQLVFSNSLGTTMGQLARGGVSSDTWFLGFNISRKFF